MRTIRSHTYAYCYSNTYAYTDTYAMHGEMWPDAQTAPNAGASTVILALVPT